MLKYEDLPESPRVEFITCDNIECDAFHEPYSATRGDYFMAPSGLVITCDRCSEPMILARRESRVVAVHR